MTPATSPIARIRLLSINDFHGQISDSDAVVDGVPIGGAATLSSYIQRERAANPTGTALVAAGDLVGASPPVSSLLRHRPTMAVLAAMGVDIATLGNHEFDRGFAEIMRLIYGDGPVAKAAAGARDIARARATGTPFPPLGRGGPRGARAWPGSAFPWVCANVVDATTRKPVLPPYAIKTLDGVKVAFVGVVTKNLKNVTTPNGNESIEATDPAAAVNALVPELKAKGIKTIVVVAHEGGRPSKTAPHGVSGEIVELVKQLDPEVDAVISGHSHQEYATTIAGKQVVQAGSYAKALGVVELDVDRRTGDVVRGASRLVRNDERGVTPDKQIAKMVKMYERKVAPVTERVVGELAEPLTRTATPAGESALGLVIADAQRARAKTDVAFMNHGGIRTAVGAGKVTWGKLFAVQPFGNRIQRVEMTGAELRALLEQQFTDGRMQVLQSSGIVTHVDVTKPQGSRVTSVTMSDGSELDPARTYTVAANSFLADGGDGFTAFKAGRNRVDVSDDLEALVEHVRSGKIAPAEPRERVIVDADAISFKRS